MRRTPGAYDDKTETVLEHNANTERIYKAQSLCNRIEEQTDILLGEAFEWDDEKGRYHYNPQVTPRTLRLLSQALALMDAAVDSVNYGTVD